jgi:hypothetical protein
MTMHRAIGFVRAHCAVVAISIALIVFPVASASTSGSSPDRSTAMQSLDQQVQDIKSDVLEIAAELRGLEEKLLYPSNTQVALFVSVNNGEGLALDSARISIDGQLVAHHIYSFKEIQALSKGGVQRIYTGNVSAGSHEVEVTVQGKHSGGRDFDAVQKFSFRKEKDPKCVGITLTAGLAGGARVEIEDW